MSAIAAAKESTALPQPERVWAPVAGVDVPDGHIGPIQLSTTGRTVWWTGRVAIGLRYQPSNHGEAFRESAIWVQRVLLDCR